MRSGAYSDGEPIEWIFAHSRTMHRIFHTVKLLKEFRVDRKLSQLSEMKKIWKEGPFAVRGELRSESVLHRLPVLQRATDQWGLAAIDEFLGGNIRGIYPRLRFAVDGNAGMEFRFGAPIEGAYFKLLQDLTESRARICKNCHTIFRAEDSRLEHCSKECRQKWATREFRKRLKARKAKRSRKA